MALPVAVPPRASALSVNVVVAVTGPTVSEPDTGLAPVQPPDAWHESVLVLDQVSVVVSPAATLGRLRLDLHRGRRRAVATAAAAAGGQRGGDCGDPDDL